MTDTTRDLLISLASHMAYMQGQLEAHHDLDDPEDYYWYRESVLLRQKVTDALADESVAPAPPADGEVAELVAWLRETGDWIQPSHLAEHQRYKRTAELLQRQALVSDALIKAECALADIAEGAPMSDEGDPLQWAERRCADTLAIIRPTMRQHKIRTSEWPPVIAHALPLPEVNNG